MKAGPNLDKVTCSFCQGKGKDPFGIMSPTSICQVCNGVGSHLIVKPHMKCSYCHGSGIEFGTRNTCLTCGGKGQVSINKKHQPCDICHGGGMEHETGLNCTKCGGSGVVEKEEA